jgi:predicted glycogen debranching enzyme
MTLEPIAIDWQAGDDPAGLLEREWLVPNGVGGFASASLAGVSTRRHHGLFVPNRSQPLGRHIMVGRFDEEIASSGAPVQLGGGEHTGGQLDSAMHRHLRRFRLDARLPCWEFAVGDAVVEKTVVMPHRHNTVLVHYRLVEGGPVLLRLRPWVLMRRLDAELREGEAASLVVSASKGQYEVRRSGTTEPVLRFGLQPAGPFTCDEREDQVLYRVEQARGYRYLEQVASPGWLGAELRAGQELTFIASTEPEGTLQPGGVAAISAERERITKLLEDAPVAARTGFAGQLTAAAEAFVVAPAGRPADQRQAQAVGSQARTVIAGYHWFSDWGRDTMISLEGLTLCTGRPAVARPILETFSRYVHEGLLPNLFPEGERQPLYHTVDATLWYFHALDRYLDGSGDRALLAQLFPVLCDIVRHHQQGTLYNIGVDPADGLLHSGAEGYQLTWMDAKVGDWVVTPRRGKPVEIQALWHNALHLMADWAQMLGEPGGGYREHAVRVHAAFNRRFWNPALGHLLDVADGEHGDDAACRPNQVFAMSLRHPVLEPAHWPAVLDTVRGRLLTPYGLRTLAPGYPDYKARYEGDLRSRDAAYHQGTVWPWLVGHFMQAWLRVHPDRRAARAMLEAFPGHLRQAGIGSISEIFDAEAPYAPRGCIAQAWSVAEVLRAWLLTEPD